MKLSSLTLAAALAVAGSAAFADTTVHRTVQVGPNGEVTHVVKRTERPDGSVRTVHRVHRVTSVTTPVVVHRKVVLRHPEYHHRHHVAYRHDNGRHLAYGHRDREAVVVHREVIRRNG